MTATTSRRARGARLTALVAALVAALAAVALATEPQRERRQPAVELPSALGVDRDALRTLPTSGAPWRAVLEAADGNLGGVDLADQDSTAPGRAVAAALVHVRTGDERYRDKVVDQLEQVPDASLRRARTLSLGRQLAGWVLAADLVSYRDEDFVAFVDRVRTEDVGNHGRWRSLEATSRDTASNWGAWATASRIAASLYVGDADDVAEAARVLRGALGERDAYAGFTRTEDFDPTWVCGDLATWVPINPEGCGGRSGALVEEASRSAGAYPDLDDTGVDYAWEALGGFLLAADLLADNGYDDVHQWGDRALLRAARWLHANGGYPTRFSVTHYIPWQVERAYGAGLGPLEPAGLGRQYGFTDWLSSTR